MLEPDTRTVAAVRQWVQKAENDLTAAAHTLKLGRSCSVCRALDQSIAIWTAEQALFKREGVLFLRHILT
jgi:HEPN domain-containing protein